MGCLCAKRNVNNSEIDSNYVEVYLPRNSFRHQNSFLASDDDSGGSSTENDDGNAVSEELGDEIDFDHE